MEEIETHRLKKVNSLIQEEVSKIISEKVDLPRGVLVTVILVDTSVDIKHARIYVSILPKHLSPSTFRLLNKNISSIQKLLNKRLVMKFVPKIRFDLDKTQDKIQRIEELLEKNKK